MRNLLVIAVCLLLLGSGLVTAAPLQWAVSDGGNGHWYEAALVQQGIMWEASKLAAENTGGYLATITSDAENNFVYGLIQGRPEFWMMGEHDGPWLGGYQDRNDPSYSEPLGGWRWVSGEPWTYSNWASVQPDNLSGVQDYLHYWDGANWDDAGGPYSPVQLYYGYVVEWDNNPIPEPSSLLALACGLCGLARMVWRRKEPKR